MRASDIRFFGKNSDGRWTAGMDEPNESAWYIFGRIAEQYGEREAALAAYARTKNSKALDLTDVTSTWALARRRAIAMGAKLE